MVARDWHHKFSEPIHTGEACVFLLGVDVRRSATEVIKLSCHGKGWRSLGISCGNLRNRELLYVIVHILPVSAKRTTTPTSVLLMRDDPHQKELGSPTKANYPKQRARFTLKKLKKTQQKSCHLIDLQNWNKIFPLQLDSPTWRHPPPNGGGCARNVSCCRRNIVFVSWVQGIKKAQICATHFLTLQAPKLSKKSFKKPKTFCIQNSISLLLGLDCLDRARFLGDSVCNGVVKYSMMLPNYWKSWLQQPWQSLQLALRMIHLYYEFWTSFFDNFSHPILVFQCISPSHQWANRDLHIVVIWYEYSTVQYFFFLVWGGGEGVWLCINENKKFYTTSEDFLSTYRLSEL